MARICNGNHVNKPYYHEHRCECGCGCKRDTLGYAYCVPCEFNCRDKRGQVPHALSFYERRYGRGETCEHREDARMCGNLCGDCNQRIGEARP